MKSKVFNFRLPEELRKYLKIVSKNNYMTMSGYIIYLLKKDMDKDVNDKNS